MANLSIKSPDELFDYITQIASEIFPDADWASLQYGSFEWLLSKEVTYLTSLVLQYLDARAKNAYLDTVTIRQDLRNIAKNLGLNIVERTGATVSLSFTATDDVTIPIGTKVTSSNGIAFTTTAELSLSTAGSLVDQVTAINAAYKQITKRASGAILETMQLNLDNVLVDWLKVNVAQEEWELVEDWSRSESTSQHYLIKLNELNQVSVVFGDGVYGKRLPADAEVIFDVFYGGGVEGNSVAAGDLTQLASSFTNSSNISEISNEFAPTGGAGAQSTNTVKALLPAQLRSVSGLINKEDTGRVIKANLTWVGDAKVATGYTTVSSTYVPTSTVIAFPYSTGIVGMSVEQSAELSDFVDRRGALGNSWLVADAYEQPLELEINVLLNNRALKSEKDAEIKEALAGTEGLFGFDNLRFDRTITDADILDTVYSVSGVNRAEIKQFSVIPQAYDLDSNTVSSIVADADLGTTAEDGYFIAAFTATQTAETAFYRPVKPDYIATTYVRDLNQNWLYKSFSFADGDAELDDVNGPYITVSGSKLHFRQNTTIFYNDELNGSTYLDRYLLKITWTDASEDVQTAYYHIADTQTPGLLISLENANAPISGTAISATFAGAGYTNITVDILRDQTNGSTGVLITPQGNYLNITHNSSNQLFLGSNPFGVVPINEYSHVHFNELALSSASDNWIANTSALRLRLHISSGWTNQKFVVYTTPLNSKNIRFTNNPYVFTLSKQNITINYI